MKLLLIHLSDIHMTSEDDVVTDRYPQIVNAVKNLDYSLDLCVLVVTGDIAYSGTAEQYLIAFDFFVNIKDMLAENLSGTLEDQAVPVHLVMIPGNHDCDFSASGTLRAVAADSILKDMSKAVDSDIVETCTAVQAAFFEFLNVMEPQRRMPSSQDYDQRLSYEYTISTKDECVKILCYNTAWLSQQEESQGRLSFPSQAIGDKQDDSDLVLAAFHHPYNWLEANNARSFREGIESIADIILTGHEHASSWRTQEGNLGQKNICVEGGILQDNADPTLSEFNVFLFDTNMHRKKYAHFSWDNDTYTLTTKSSSGDDGSGLGWTDYRINGIRAIRHAQLSECMRSYLSDPGISLRHGERGLLTLQDVFVYPDLVEVNMRDERFGQRVPSDHLLRLLESNPKMLITGDSESGKTCLAKKLFLDVLQNGVVPVLIDGTIKPPRGDKIYGYIERLFSEQYDKRTLDAYTQTDKSLRAIIVDDYDKLPLTNIQKRAFLASLSSFANVVVLMAHDITSDLSVLSNPQGLSGSSVEMVHYRIQPFGYVGRDRLVERWMLLGESAEPTDNSYARRLENTTQTLNTLVGKNYIPSYPVYVLSVLQALDSATPIDITASTHGYFYELFIRTTLARGRSSKDFDIIASYLAFVSYKMQEKGVKIVSDAELKAIHQAFERQYDIERPFEVLKRQFVEQGILSNINDGFRFKYSYLYNYFVASYMRDHIAEPGVHEMLGHITRTVYTENNANILLFLAHLSKDPVIINELLTASRDLYPAHRPAALKDDINFLAHLWSGLPDAVYEENDPKANREAMLAEMDRNISPDTGIDDSVNDQEEPEVDAEDPIVQFVTALRHLEILGQVLKNFPGSLEASMKLDIARECYHLGLRSLSAVFKMIQVEELAILQGMSQEIRNRHPDLATGEIRSRARESLTGLVHVLSYGLIKRVANAVGSRDLFNTYNRLLGESQTPAFSLINLALNLDNRSEFPDSLIRNVASEFRKTPLPLSVLRHLVVAHFRLFPVDFRTKQGISSTIGIRYLTLQRASPRARMLPRGKVVSQRR